MQEQTFCFLIIAFSGLVYYNTFNADFAYDDNRAIRENEDIRPTAPISDIFFNDFWGTSIQHSGSHKSYRPLCVLSFRLNYLLGELNPWGYHVFNVTLHVLVCLLYFHLLSVFVFKDYLWSLFCTILFSVHPIHCEAVAGIVGRADVGSALFFLIAFISYLYHITFRYYYVQHAWICFACCVLFAIISLLFKETGITVLGICFLYDICTVTRLHPFRLGLLFRSKALRPILASYIALSITIFLILFLRYLVMGSAVPSFSASDNPAAHSAWYIRLLTFTYLPVANMWLLLCPWRLSFDWSMDAVPLVTKLWDHRLFLSLIFYVPAWSLTVRLMRSLAESSAILYDDRYDENFNLEQRASNRRSFFASAFAMRCSQPLSDADAALLAVLLLVLPFLPATNLFFYVGFVLAERVLYMPSLGFCLLLTLAFRHFAKFSSFHENLIKLMAFVLLLSQSCRTVLRNYDWLTEESLYVSGTEVNPAKAWSNLGNIYASRNLFELAEASYKNALQVRGNMGDTHYNLGVLYQNHGDFLMAEHAYRNALLCRPFFTVAYLNLALCLEKQNREKEMEEILLKAIHISGEGIKDQRSYKFGLISSLYNLGRLYRSQNRIPEALELLNEALEKRPQSFSPHSIYNLIGECYLEQSLLDESEQMFQLSVKTKPSHIPGFVNLVKFYQNEKKDLDKAEFLLTQKIQSLPSANFQLMVLHGSLLLQKEEFTESLVIYQSVVETFNATENLSEVYYNMGTIYRNLKRFNDSVSCLKRAIGLHPNFAHAYMNLGALYHLIGQYAEAESAYEQALILIPEHEHTLQNLQKLKRLMQKKSQPNTSP